MRGFVLAALLCLAACGPAQQGAHAPGASAPNAPAPNSRAPNIPTPAACNDVSVNPARRVQILPDTVAVASSETELLGGPIAPGLYDLVSITPREGSRIGADALWESLRVSEDTHGERFDFAVAIGAASAAPMRTSALLHEGANAQLVHICGGQGAVSVSWRTSGAGELHLTLPGRGGVGHDELQFTRRAG